jgi:hypothetical protein
MGDTETIDAGDTAPVPNRRGQTFHRIVLGREA